MRVIGGNTLCFMITLAIPAAGGTRTSLDGGNNRKIPLFRIGVGDTVRYPPALLFYPIT